MSALTWSGNPQFSVVELFMFEYGKHPEVLLVMAVYKNLHPDTKVISVVWKTPTIQLSTEHLIPRGVTLSVIHLHE